MQKYSRWLWSELIKRESFIRIVVRILVQFECLQSYMVPPVTNFAVIFGPMRIPKIGFLESEIFFQRWPVQKFWILYQFIEIQFRIIPSDARRNFLDCLSPDSCSMIGSHVGIGLGVDASDWLVWLARKSIEISVRIFATEIGPGRVVRFFGWFLTGNTS